MEPIGSSETSLSNPLKPRNNPGNERRNTNNLILGIFSHLKTTYRPGTPPDCRHYLFRLKSSDQNNEKYSGFYFFISTILYSYQLCVIQFLYVKSGGMDSTFKCYIRKAFTNFLALKPPPIQGHPRH